MLKPQGFPMVGCLSAQLQQGDEAQVIARFSEDRTNSAIHLFDVRKYQQVIWKGSTAAGVEYFKAVEVRHVILFLALLRSLKLFNGLVDGLIRFL